MVGRVCKWNARLIGEGALGSGTLPRLRSGGRVARGDAHFPVYDMRVFFDVRLSGLAYLLYYWWFTSAVFEPATTG